MGRDEDELRELNMKIGTAESNGDRAFLADVVAPVLAFRRANGAFVDRATFLDDVKPGAFRETEIESVTLLERDRAVVTCTVVMVIEGQRKRFHNVRLFVRSDATWKLLAWANEPA